jgi:transcriptional regulator with XRE-family HTH domain
MIHNVRHMNIMVKRKCAWPAIGSEDSLRYDADMARIYRKTFLRQWRKKSGRTLVQVAEYLHMTHGQLSKIERGEQPYNQALLEALAELYMCEPVDLLIRDPLDPEGIWSLWQSAKPGDRNKIVKLARAILDEGGEETQNHKAA